MFVYADRRLFSDRYNLEAHLSAYKRGTMNRNVIAILNKCNMQIAIDAGVCDKRSNASQHNIYKWSSAAETPRLQILSSRRKGTWLFSTDPQQTSRCFYIFEMQKLPFALESWLICESMKLMQCSLNELPFTCAFSVCTPEQDMPKNLKRLAEEAQSFNCNTNFDRHERKWIHQVTNEYSPSPELSNVGGTSAN